MEVEQRGEERIGQLLYLYLRCIATNIVTGLGGIAMLNTHAHQMGPQPIRPSGICSTRPSPYMYEIRVSYKPPTVPIAMGNFTVYLSACSEMQPMRCIVRAEVAMVLRASRERLRNWEAVYVNDSVFNVRVESCFFPNLV
jgi:hypothetical protein